jgi:3-oxoacyl-[acyl-carrier protein] reductase
LFDRLLDGKRVLVTGASRGLGRALCLAFARHGATLAFNYNSDEEGGARTLALLREVAPQAPHQMHRASVLDAEGFGRMVKAIETALGGIDILVNNAGISQSLPLALMEDADWDLVMDTNAKGSYIAARTVLRGMVRRKSGCILDIGSLAGARTIEAPVHYCASKAAVHGFTRALAKEMARHGIRVNALAPGLLEDGVGRNLPEHRLRDYLEHVALGRVGTLDEVAQFAAFLVSDLNSYMNGEVVVMDGGL